MLISAERIIWETKDVSKIVDSIFKLMDDMHTADQLIPEWYKN